MSGFYGIPVIAHCCLEPHGQVTEVKTANFMSGLRPKTYRAIAIAWAIAVGIAQNKIHVEVPA